MVIIIIGLMCASLGLFGKPKPAGLALPSDRIADCFRLERQIPWHQEASNTRSMTNRESMQCSEVVMQLQRMCSSPRVAFETFDESFPEPSSTAASKFKLRELD